MLEMHLTCPHCKRPLLFIRLWQPWSLTALLTAAPAVIHPLAITGLKKSNRPFCSWQILTSA